MVTGNYMVRMLIAVVLCMASVSFAQTPTQQNGGGIPLGLLQKQAFAQKLVEDESVANRIQASQQVEAKRLLDLARDSYSKALIAVSGKDFNQAESRFNEVVSYMGKAHRLVPDTEAIVAQQRTEYDKTLDIVESLERSYLSYSRRVKLYPGGSGDSGESGDRVNSINSYMDSSRAYAKAGKWNDALQSVQKAQMQIKYEMGRILGLMAADYITKFDTQSEEVAYQIDRDHKLLELIPVVVSELQPSEDILSTIDDLTEQNGAVMDLAEEYAKQQDFSKALRYAHAGIGYLEIALTSGGLILPQVSAVK